MVYSEVWHHLQTSLRFQRPTWSLISLCNQMRISDDDDGIIPPTGVTSAFSTSQDIGDLFNEIFDTLAVLQNSNLSSDTLDTGTPTSTTEAAADASCSLEATLKLRAQITKQL